MIPAPETQEVRIAIRLREIILEYNEKERETLEWNEWVYIARPSLAKSISYRRWIIKFVNKQETHPLEVVLLKDDSRVNDKALQTPHIASLIGHMWAAHPST